MRAKKVAAAAAAVFTISALAPAAHAAGQGWGNETPITSGPDAAKVIQTFDPNWRSQKVPLREGNSKFGRQHIAKGGSTGNKGNHELTSAAKALWVKAMENVNKGSSTHPFPGGTLSTYPYKTSGGYKRTMCVVDDANNFTFHGKNYGPRGIITAFWVDGHTGPSGCSKKG
ncbi:hypothetical protein AB0B79_39395 [Streptomyces sp. NPDC039022]|uniref:hypothetical protein n=1 Tax=unclassified Streptomyces TaxID=2593676 RepID=UPI003408F81B